MKYMLWRATKKLYPKNIKLIKMSLSNDGALNMYTCNSIGTVENILISLKPQGYFKLFGGVTDIQFIRAIDKGHVVVLDIND